MITESLKLTTTPIVTLFSIDFSTCLGFNPTTPPIIYFSPNRDGTNDIFYNSNTYNWIGAEGSGFRTEINGDIPAPSLTLDKASWGALPQYQSLKAEYVAQRKQLFFDWRGAIFTRTKMHWPNAGQVYPTERYVVSRINKITPSAYEVEMSVSLGANRLNSQSVQTLAANRCSLRYRTWNAAINDFDYVPENAGGCPYGNPTTTNNWSAVPSFGLKYFTKADIELAPANKNLDACSYTVKGCQIRFDPALQGLTLPFTGTYNPASVSTKG